jgi:hypothetical protein
MFRPPPHAARRTAHGPRNKDVMQRTSGITRRLFSTTLLALALALALPCAVRAVDADADSTVYYFYHGRDEGSESLGNPLRLIVNGGFGILQMENRSNQLSDVSWANGWRNLWRNLGHPLEAIDQRGWWDFIATEILPVSVDRQSSQYWPNYMNHLIGGGMSYRRTREYYTWHGIPHPNLAAVTTIAAYHLLNETVEMNGRTGWTVDPIADIYLFDIASILVFSSDTVSRFFGHTLNMADWSFMPLYDPETGNLENVGQNYMVRLGLGHTVPWSLFYHWGNGGELGLTRNLGGQHNLSVGAGFVAKNITDVDEFSETVNLVSSGGLFYDRGGNLMAGLLYAPNKDSRWRLNVYPGLLRLGPFKPGFTVIVAEDSDVLAGITFGNIPLVPAGISRRFYD